MTEDPRPCGYCWDHHCDLDGWECAEKHAPEGGFAQPHAECQAEAEAMAKLNAEYAG